MRRGLFRVAERLETLYVGGGTPSLLGPNAMSELRQLLGPERVTGSTLEWTAEANPESFTDEVARDWVSAGVNRLSLGVQSFQDAVLRWMGRLHGPDGSMEAVARARRAGLHELSVDLIFGLPAGLRRSWRDDLERTLALEVPHLSLYGLSVEAATPLGRAVAEGLEPPPDDARYREEFLEAASLLTVEGYRHYEVSNFALPGHESRHNSVYWAGEPYLGLGNGAHSYQHPLRRWNVRDWSAYQEAARAGRLAVGGSETLDPEAARLEWVWLSLRTDRGVRVSDLPGRGIEVVESWARRGWATVDAGRAKLSAEGWLLLDRLAVELDGALDDPDQPVRRGRLPLPGALAQHRGSNLLSDRGAGERDAEEGESG